MPTSAEFRIALLDHGVDAVLEQFLLSDDASHVSAPQCQKINEELAFKYGVAAEDVTVCIVGSAKLGFSIVEKNLPDGSILPRYRLFGAESDVDVAVISPKIFDQIWLAVSAFSHRAVPWPWRSKRLGDYLVCGWFRPDHFPVPRPRKCQDWWDCFGQLSAEAFLGRRKVSGALYHSREHLIQYQRRAVEECLRIEELNQ